MAKWSFENTIGELLDDPQTLELVKELAPEAFDHPLLELGRNFSVNAAMPFILDYAGENGEERVENFRKRLEELG